MAQHYVQEIPDYARLNRLLLEQDVSRVSYEYLKALETPQDVETIARFVGQRRQRQGVSLPALLRAYRLWARDALEALCSLFPNAVEEYAPKVGQILDLVSEASIQGYQQAVEGALYKGPFTGLAVGLSDAGAVVLVPRFLHLSSDQTVYVQSPLGSLLFLAIPFIELEEALRSLARRCKAVLWVEEGLRLSDLQADLEEALALGRLLNLPPGVYPTRFLWPLAMAIESTKGRDRLLRFLEPLEGHPELIRTLEAYLQAGLSLKGTAYRLGLHPNTVLYRLRRVQELSSINLERVEDLCLLSLALQLYRLTEGTAPTQEAKPG